MSKFIPLCALFMLCTFSAFAQAKEERITQGVVTETTTTTYETITTTESRRMTKEEWAELKQQRRAERQAYRDSLVSARMAQYEADSANRAAQAILRDERLKAVRGWKNYININISGAQPKYGTGVKSPSIGIEYIGGRRFNRFLFWGFGTGIVFNTHRESSNWYDTYSSYPSSVMVKQLGLCTVSFPLYTNFRLYLSSRKCQPYISLSTGFRFSGSKREQVYAYSILSSADEKIYNNSSYEVKHGTTQYFISPGLGFDFVNNKGKGFSLQASFMAITTPWMRADRNGNTLNIDVKHSMKPGYHVQIGYTF